MMGGLAGLVGYLLAVYAVALIGGRVTSRNLDNWYKGLRKPSWQPPNWLFGPVWAILYTTMAVAAWRGDGNLGWWWVQLALNLLWSILFFGYKRIGLAFVAILLLLGAIWQTIQSFSAYGSPMAALLMVPYLLWVAYAALLNGAIWYLNRE